MKYVLVAAMMFAGSSAFAQTYIYPTKGQSAAQQSRDQGECHQWAARQTGFDPAAAGAPSTYSAAPPPAGGAVRGAARGALAGAAVGAIAGDTGKGAAIGATVGGFGGAYRRRDQRMRMQAEQRALEAEQQRRQAEFQRAFAVCMEGRGYTVR